jgi:succinoglycan biosynthesis transport protein ExoP
VLPDQACQRRLETQVASSLGTRNSVNVQREAEIRAALDAQKKRLLDLRSQRDELAVLQREV